MSSRDIYLSHNRAEMGYRIGKGRFKLVMWYRQMLGYGNDIINQPVKGWNERQREQYAEFASHLLPRNT